MGDFFDDGAGDRTRLNIAAFGRAGTVICKRVPGRVERGDCLFHLADDFVP